MNLSYDLHITRYATGSFSRLTKLVFGTEMSNRDLDF